MPCCAMPHLVQETITVLLKEPPTPVRFVGTRCRECDRLHVSEADVALNQARALRAAAKVRPSASMWRDLYREAQSA